MREASCVSIKTLKFKLKLKKKINNLSTRTCTVLLCNGSKNKLTILKKDHLLFTGLLFICDEISYFYLYNFLKR